MTLITLFIGTLTLVLVLRMLEGFSPKRVKVRTEEYLRSQRRK